MYRSDPELAARTVAAVGAALADLPADRSEHELLAVFAARLTGDPHAFDAKEPAGALLEHALRERFRPPPEGLRPGAARAFLLDQAGLGVDQVSSTVLVAHLAEACRADGTPYPMVGGNDRLQRCLGRDAGRAAPLVSRQGPRRTGVCGGEPARLRVAA